MTDLTPVINAAIALFCAIITAFLVPWIKRRTSAQDRDELLEWVDIAVAAAQQLYHNLDGVERKAYVLTLLRGKGFDVDSVAVDAAIEAAVIKLHNQLEGTT